MTTIYQFEAPSITGEMISLASFKDHPLLIVNTASKCGFTPQFKGLEDLHKTYKDKGLVILGFPCNQFGAQDPGSDTEIATFCQMNYQTTFQMMSKVLVNGETAHPLFQWLTSQAPGMLGSIAIKWNFTKFLVSKDGQSVERFGSIDAPDKLQTSIEKLL